MVLPTDRQPGQQILSADINDIAGAVNNKADIEHDHDDKYYTKEEADSVFVQSVPILFVDSIEDLPAGTPVDTLVVVR